MNTNSCCAILGAFVLILVAISGPVYAFFFMSCVSTRPCSLGVSLHYTGATCSEGPSRAEEMLHGQACTLQCPSGYEPSQPSITCNDGTIEGLETVHCRYITVRDTRPFQGGLVDGAITSGEVETACSRGQNLGCEARPGGSSILISLAPVSRQRCDSLLAECQGYNSNYHWSQHQEEANGTCTLGCFRPLASAEDTQATTLPPSTTLNILSAPASTLRPVCTDGPACIELSGGCNAGDDGDYFRFRYCASDRPQWVNLEETHRIRYDGLPQYAQGGAWLLERGSNPMTDYYSQELARQPYQELLPKLGTFTWNARCITRVNAFTQTVELRETAITLGACSCTSAKDCSGHGQAVGSKDLGPNCNCLCDLGWGGDHCELQLCQAPAILHARVPPCAEGFWLRPGQICTPRCEDTYEPKSPSYLCENGLLTPTLFQCDLQIAVGGADLGGPVDPAPPTTASPDPGPCTDADCFFRGVTVGGRQRDGSCVCQCNEGWGGADCRTVVGSCRAPLPSTINNVALPTCREGTTVPTTCTAQCAEGYYPLPPTLACTGVVLSPATFRCFGGSTTRERWCQTMRYISVAASCVAVLGLCAGCFCGVGRIPARKTKSYGIGNTHVEVTKDVDGDFNIVRGAFDINPHLPAHVKYAVQPEFFEPAAEPPPAGDLPALRDAASPVKANNPLRELADAVEVPGVAGEPLSSLAIDVREAGVSGIDDPLALQVQEDISPWREGLEVFILATDEHPDYAGRKGTLMSKEEDHRGFWLVALEGFDGYRVLHEQSFTLPAPPPVPEEVGETHGQWLLELYERDKATRDAEKQREAQFKRAAQRAEEERQAAIQAVLDSTAVEREDLEDAAREGLRLGDIASLRETLKQGKALLERLQSAPASSKISLTHVIEVVGSRLEQYDEREAARQRKREYDQRILTGQTADWKMTKEEFWQHVEDGSVERVRAGLKAQLSVHARSQDRLRLSLLHVACRPTCTVDEDTSSKHLEVVRELLQARAHANAVDMEGRTPLDLALSLGGEDASDTAAAKTLGELGFRTAHAAADEARAEAESRAPSGPASPSPVGPRSLGGLGARGALQASSPAAGRRFR